MPTPNRISSEERRTFEQFAPGVAYVVVEDRSGDQKVGTCFHIGAYVFITARHVVEGFHVRKIATTNAGIRQTGRNYVATFSGREAPSIEGPFYHPTPEYDIAALRLSRLHAPQIPLLPLVEDRFANKVLLWPAVVMGFPPIPGSSSPVLVCARAEINASFENYFDGQRVYIASCLARGGFSGGPVITNGRCLGVVTRAMVTQKLPPELGFMAVIPPVPILELLDHHRIMPGYLRQQIWEPYLRMSEGAAPPDYFI